jgi:hypothetical protein
MRELSIADLVDLVGAEFSESPGLRLTRSQIQRLWRLDPSDCDAVLTALVGAGVLRQTPGGAYVRAAAGDDISLPSGSIRRPRPLPRD